MLKVLVSTLSTQGELPGDFGCVPADELVEEHDLRAANRLPIGLVVGRRAWNYARRTVDSPTYPRRRCSRCSALGVTFGTGPTVHLAARMGKPGLRTLVAWMNP